MRKRICMKLLEENTVQVSPEGLEGSAGLIVDMDMPSTTKLVQSMHRWIDRDYDNSRGIFS